MPESVEAYVTRRLALTLYTGDMAVDVHLRTLAAYWGTIAGIASRAGWVTAEGWRQISDELFPGILLVCFDRLRDLMNGQDYQQATADAGTLQADTRASERRPIGLASSSPPSAASKPAEARGVARG